MALNIIALVLAVLGGLWAIWAIGFLIYTVWFDYDKGFRGRR